MLLDQVLQPSIISLFSSTSSHPLLLATSIRSGNTAESFSSLLRDDSSQEETLLSFNGQPTELEQRTQALLQGEERQNSRSRVLHLQGPDIRKTSVRWGNWFQAKGKVEGLGIQLEYLHLQVKNLEQDFFFDVAVQDDRKEVFVFRCSTFQTKPKYYPPTDNRPAMLHLPLAFPPSSSTLLTSWSTITLPLATLLSQLPSLGTSSSRRFSCVLGIEVHANCRIRRIWFSNDGKEADEWLARKGLMSELALYAKENE